MDLKQVMRELKDFGTAQNIKVYRRHGAKADLFGVSFANLGKLKKKIKTNHDLAGQLWETGNVDARTLATMVADPSRITVFEAEKWVKGVDYYLLGDMLAALVAQSPLAAGLVRKWTKSKKEYVRQSGYALVASALKEGVDLSVDDCRHLVSTIEKEIHDSPNRARHAMNGALIAIGVYRAELTEDCLSAAARIGKVEVDHGETSCKTPDAITYIKKSIKRRS